MIFATVGTQLPFDRLTVALDQWAASHPGTEVVVQAGRSRFQPLAVETVSSVSPARFREYLETCDLLVAHAGMGTVLSALALEKPLLIMPRQAALGEHRNDHQLATARALEERGLVTVAYDQKELLEKLEQHHAGQPLPVPARLPAEASPQLLETVREFLQAGRTLAC